MGIVIKRIYEPAREDDGRRILVDRLWPRGVSRDGARLDAWLKDAAPSAALRTWFGHQEARFGEFARLYQAELDADPLKQAAVTQLLQLGAKGRLTLLYGAKSEEINHAAVLRQYLLARSAN